MEVPFTPEMERQVIAEFIRNRIPLDELPKLSVPHTITFTPNTFHEIKVEVVYDPSREEYHSMVATLDPFPEPSSVHAVQIPEHLQKVGPPVWVLRRPAPVYTLSEWCAVFTEEQYAIRFTALQHVPNPEYRTVENLCSTSWAIAVPSHANLVRSSVMDDDSFIALIDHNPAITNDLGLGVEVRVNPLKEGHDRGLALFHAAVGVDASGIPSIDGGSLFRAWGMGGCTANITPGENPALTYREGNSRMHCLASGPEVALRIMQQGLPLRWEKREEVEFL